MKGYEWLKLEQEIAEAEGEERYRLAKLENDMLDAFEEKEWDNEIN